ncbi:unnamed protein product [Chrysoparadoxa australica]
MALICLPSPLEPEQLKLGIIVPFRDQHEEQKRAKHLKQFYPYMEAMLCRAMAAKGGGSFHIYVIEQSQDDRKFNRGKLLNIGFDQARQDGCNSFIFHDVDLLPSEDLSSWYTTYPRWPIHIARRWDRYSATNTDYFGGIVSFNEADYLAINGYPNTFWGWGGEDDEMHKRTKEVGLLLVAPDVGSIEDLEQMDLNQKLSFLRSHKEWKCNVKTEALKEHSSTWSSLSTFMPAKLTWPELYHSPSPGTHSCPVVFQVDVQLNSHWTDTEFNWETLERWSLV